MGLSVRLGLQRSVLFLGRLCCTSAACEFHAGEDGCTGGKYWTHRWSLWASDSSVRQDQFTTTTLATVTSDLWNRPQPLINCYSAPKEHSKTRELHRLSVRQTWCKAPRGENKLTASWSWSNLSETKSSRMQRQYATSVMKHHEIFAVSPGLPEVCLWLVSEHFFAWLPVLDPLSTHLKGKMMINPFNFWGNDM